jgi:AbrB family looped-hinge helix DNA binding protein
MNVVASVPSWKRWVLKMDRRGRIALPSEIRLRLGVTAGDTLRLTEAECGLRIERLPSVSDEVVA